MPCSNGTCFVVDDDADMRDSLKWLMESAGIAIKLFSSAEQFLDAYTPKTAGCLLLDVRMPGMSGLELLDQLNSMGSRLPVVMYTGHGEVPMAVRCLRDGALHFLEKPATHEDILKAVREALEKDRISRAQNREREEIERVMATLSERQREILDRIIEGQANKAIAIDLQISERTVEKHRENIMQKTGARSLATLARMVMIYRLGTAPPGKPPADR
jgi:two-component system, LuxR family, response regulator FixJ